MINMQYQLLSFVLENDKIAMSQLKSQQTTSEVMDSW